MCAVDVDVVEKLGQLDFPRDLLAQGRLAAFERARNGRIVIAPNDRVFG
jgi:hypothetical protein